MANDLTLPVRRAVLTHAAADMPLAEEIPAGSIHPQSPLTEPTWPFVKFGAPSGIPIRAACVDGNEIIFAMHGFSKGRWNLDGALAETAEDHAARIGALIADALDGAVLDLEGGGRLKLRWDGSQLLQDGEDPGAYHTVQNFTARALK